MNDVGLPVLWLDPNADAGSRAILQTLDGARLPAGSVRMQHLPRARYCGAMRHCSVMVGNSSSGIIEAATFGTPVVNIGSRQHMREHGPNVLHVPPDADPIAAAMRRQLSHGKWPCENPWGDGQAGQRIADLLARLPLDGSILDKTNSY
jgi:GDP/UDP-N,N'-diacetylbacillosamine 2-epimerase (hydrolysing)